MRTMAEYITKKAAINAVENAPIELFQSEWEEIEEAINTAPAADVVPVVHGRWIQVDSTKCRCSHCDIIALIALYPHGDKNFCPNCGAKMDRGAE